MKETIKTINAHRDKHIGLATRLDTVFGNMIWTGDDEETTREQWEHIQGPRSLNQTLALGQLQTPNPSFGKPCPKCIKNPSKTIPQTRNPLIFLMEDAEIMM